MTSSRVAKGEEEASEGQTAARIAFLRRIEVCVVRPSSSLEVVSIPLGGRGHVPSYHLTGRRLPVSSLVSLLLSPSPSLLLLPCASPRLSLLVSVSLSLPSPSLSLSPPVSSISFSILLSNLVSVVLKQ